MAYDFDLLEDAVGYGRDPVHPHFNWLRLREIIQSVAIAINMSAPKQDFDHTMALYPSTDEEFIPIR